MNGESEKAVIMRNSILVILLFAFGSAIAQQNPSERGGAPLLDLDSDETGVIRALVIGISEYKYFRPNLQFAHRDAEVFYEYLLSKSGGSLPKENIKLLTNENATGAAIDAGLVWLSNETQKGDRAIIYYAGHGDVDKKTLKERGYLIAYDTPSDVYRGTAVRVEDLDDFVSWLSVKGESKAIIIIDACRSGKLDKDKMNLTGKELEKQAENEVRIMACKHDQKSLEDPSWGGGRGLFSYHLVNGLMGLADEGKDLLVDFEEVKQYVERNIKASLAQAGRVERQNPVFVGDELFKLASVDEQELAALNQSIASNENQPMAMAASQLVMGASPGRGADSETGAGADAATADKVQVSSAVMSPQTFLAPVQLTRQEEATMEYLLKSAEIKEMVLTATFEKAMKSREDLFNYFLYELPSHTKGEQKKALKVLLDYAEKDPKRREELAMQLVVELHNRSQAAINAYLQADANELAQRQFKDLAVQYVHYPRMLKAAILLAGPDYSLLKRMQVKQLYFDGVCDRLLLQIGTAGIDKEAPMRKQREALALDDRAPYIHNEIGLLYVQENNIDSAKYHYEKAIELAPNWAIPYSNLSNIYQQENQLEKAKTSANKAIQLKPDYANANINLGNAWFEEKHLLKAEVAYRKALLIDENSLNAYYQLGNLMALRTEYSEANELFNEVEKLKTTMLLFNERPNVLGHPSPFDPTLRPTMFDTRTHQFLHFSDEPKTAQEFLHRGKFYFGKKQYFIAEPYLRKVLDFDTENNEVYYYLGLSLYHLGRYEEAELALLKLLKLRPNEPELKLHLADVYIKQHRRLEEEELYEELLIENPAPAPLAKDIYERMDNLLSVQKRYPEQEKWLVEYEALFEDSDIKLDSFYYKMVEQFPENSEWLYRLGAYQYQYGSDWEGANYFEQIMALDTTYPAMAHLHERVGQRYEYSNDAIWHFKEALRLDSSMVAAKYSLVDIFRHNRQFEEAIPVLEDLLRNGQINLPQRLQLGDLYALSGKFVDADSLLTKADKIKFEPTLGLNEIRGKLAMYQARYEEAIRFYEAEIALKPENMRQLNQYTLARLAAKAGNQTAALDWLKKTLDDGFNYKWVIKYDDAWSEYQQNKAFNDLLDAHKMRPSIF